MATRPAGGIRLADYITNAAGAAVWPEDTAGLSYAVADLAARNAIPASKLQIGQSIYVVGDGPYRVSAISGSTVTWVVDATGLNGVTVTGTPAAGYGLIATSSTAAVWTAPPSGTGFVPYLAGVRAGAARAIDLSTVDVTGVLPAANGGASSPTGTGFSHVTGGARDSAARAVDLSTVDVTGVLPAANMSAPTGTGFSHVTGGARDSAARAVDLSTADVTGVLPAANGGASSPTGTGFSHVTGGARDSAARAVDLSTADVTGVLPAINGGGQVLWPTQSTASGTPVLLASTPIVSTGAGVSVFAHVLFDDNGTSVYDQVGQGLWRNNAGTLVGVATPPPPAGNGSLLGCALSLVVNNTLHRIELYGTLSGTAIGTTIYMTPELTSTLR
jgi:hypothetical protein